jgi:hypothetical protein
LGTPRRLKHFVAKIDKNYEGNGTLTDGGRVRMVYAVLNINDPLLTLLAKGSNEIRQTTWQAYQEHNELLLLMVAIFRLRSP